MISKILFVLLLSPLLVIGQSKAPNVIIFLADDLRFDALGYNGNSYIKTPNLDSLASHGVRFNNTYIQGSHIGALCAPSRAMLLTGKSYFRIKDQMAGHENIAKKLKDNGYTTYLSGKWHNEPKVVAESFSFAKDIMFAGMSNHFQVPCQDLLPDGSFSEISYKGFSTDVFTEAMLGFIENHDSSKPFLMYLPFTAPHDPRTPSPQYAEMYKTMPLPPNFMPLHPFSFGYPMGIRDEYLAPYPRTPEVIKEQWAEYAGMISHMDDAIGKIMHALKSRGLDKNTLVVFLSDNGLALGSHGLLGKQSAYEHSMKIPMLMSGLNLSENQENDQLIYSFDLFPTILELIGISTVENPDGKSFLQSIQNPKILHRESILLAYREHQRAIRKGDYKLIRYPFVDKVVLYNLKNDPYELVDLSAKPEMEFLSNYLMKELENQQQVYADSAALSVKGVLPLNWDYRTIKRTPDIHQPKSILDKYFKEG